MFAVYNETTHEEYRVIDIFGLQLLQHLPDMDVTKLITLALKLRHMYQIESKKKVFTLKNKEEIKQKVNKQMQTGKLKMKNAMNKLASSIDNFLSEKK